MWFWTFFKSGSFDGYFHGRQTTFQIIVPIDFGPFGFGASCGGVGGGGGGRFRGLGFFATVLLFAFGLGGGGFGSLGHGFGFVFGGFDRLFLIFLQFFFKLCLLNFLF